MNLNEKVLVLNERPVGQVKDFINKKNSEIATLLYIRLNNDRGPNQIIELSECIDQAIELKEKFNKIYPEYFDIEE